MKIRLIAYEPFGAKRGVAPEWSEIEYAGKLNDLPTLKIKVMADSVAAYRLKPPCEVALEISNDDGATWIEPPDCRFISTGLEIDSANPAAYMDIPLLGIGVALRWASVWDATAGNGEGKRVFPASTPGAIIQTLFSAAAKRRDAAGQRWAKNALAWNVTPEQDSSGSAWGKNADPTFTVSDSLEKVMQWLASKGAIDYRFQGRTMEAFREDAGMARRLEDSVILRKEFSTAQPVRLDFQQIATVARFRGNAGFEKTKSLPDAYDKLGMIEHWSEQGQVSTGATADLYLDAVLTAGHRPAEQWRREYDLSAGAYVPHLWNDYRIGDWVSNGIEPLRIVEAGIKVDHDYHITGWETLGTRIDSYLERLARRTTDLSSGAVGSDSGRPLPEGADTRTPAAPKDVVCAPDCVVTEKGDYQGIITVSWKPVTSASNNTPMDVDSYIVYARLEGSDSWMNVAETENGVCNAAFNAEAGKTYAVSVVAVSKTGRHGLRSPAVRVDVPTDRVPPPRPSTPTLVNKLGMLTISWDGLAEDGQAMPPDLDAIEVFVTKDAGAKPERTASVSGAGVNRWVCPSDGVGDYWVAIRARDNAGNTSGWTELKKIAIKQLVDLTDIKADLDNAVNASTGEALTHWVNKLSGKRSVIAGGRIPPDGAPIGALWKSPEGKIFKQIDLAKVSSNADIVKSSDGSCWERLSEVDQASVEGSNKLIDVIGSQAIPLENITVGAGATSEVANELWANAIKARLVASDGIITDSMIATGAITAPKIVASQELTAKVGKFLKIRGDQIEANSITGEQVKTGSLDAEVIKMGEDARFTASGLTIYYPAGEGISPTDWGKRIPAIDITSSGKRFISVGDATGKTTASMSPDGMIAGRALSIAGDARVSELHIGGKTVPQLISENAFTTAGFVQLPQMVHPTGSRDIVLATSDEIPCSPGTYRVSWSCDYLVYNAGAATGTACGPTMRVDTRRRGALYFGGEDKAHRWNNVGTVQSYGSATVEAWFTLNSNDRVSLKPGFHVYNGAYAEVFPSAILLEKAPAIREYGIDSMYGGGRGTTVRPTRQDYASGATYTGSSWLYPGRSLSGTISGASLYDATVSEIEFIAHCASYASNLRLRVTLGGETRDLNGTTVMTLYGRGSAARRYENNGSLPFTITNLSDEAVCLMPSNFELNVTYY